jgi:hypothetical protein
MVRYLHGLSHGALLCAVGLGVWIYGMSFWTKLNLQIWYLTSNWADMWPF